jgi:diamine N-acetyltransferase
MTQALSDAPVKIVPLDAKNWEDAANLTLLPEQEGFVAPNVRSIAESRFHPELQPCAIYAGQTMVGFCMYARNPDDGQYWIYRFMIDQRYQRQGLGLRAITALIERIASLPNVPEINIGYDDHNEPARQLYRRAGFVEGGFAPWGERTAKLIVSPG